MSKNAYDNERVIFGYGEDDLKMTNPNRKFILFFEEELEIVMKRKKNIRILDVGCGAGSITKSLKRMFPDFSFTGCDISRHAIASAKEQSKGIKFLVADATDLPFKSNQFDIVMMNSVLDHTTHPKRAVNEVYRVLKKRGRYLFTSPLEDEPTTIHGQLTRFKSFRNHRKNRCGHLHTFRKKSLFELIKSAGFEIESARYDWFYLAQFIDILYYPVVSLVGGGPEVTVNSYVNKNKNIFSATLKNIRKLVVFIENIESSLTKSIPLGWFAYVSAKK